MTLRRAGMADIPLIAERMRQADRDEVLASGGFSPEAALERALGISEIARTVFVDGEPLAMFGVVALAPAIPWVLTTTAVDRYQFTFWKASKAILLELREAYPIMVQMVDARYAAALRWAKCLGFVVGELEPFGRAGLPFRRIQIGGACV